MVFTVIFTVVVSIYSALIIALAFGFARLEPLPEPKSVLVHSISVIVAARNENLDKLVRSFALLKYSKWEVIVVDDNSDNPIDLRASNIRVLSSMLPGKKAAISAGIAAAKGDIIVTTDADCTVDQLWLEKINLAFQDPITKMVVGGVRIEENRSFFSKLQALEFVSVAATGAATLGLGFPTMCNGANLAYRKDAFIEVGGYEGNEKFSSGDDEFLMNKFDKKSIRYLYSADSLVTSSPLPLVTSFINQRLRWAGKWKINTSISTRLFAVVVWLFHVAFVVMPFTAMFGFLPWKLFFILAGAKMFVESLLLIPAANFFRVKWRWISFFVLQFVYSVYVIYVGFMSQILSPEWKGRAVETKV